MSPSNALLTAGYLAAGPTSVAILRIAWRRNLPMFVLLEAGTAAVTTGWALKGNTIGAWANGGFGVGFLATWIAVGRVRARREGDSASR